MALRIQRTLFVPFLDFTKPAWSKFRILRNTVSSLRAKTFVVHIKKTNGHVWLTIQRIFIFFKSRLIEVYLQEGGISPFQILLIVGLRIWQIFGQSFLKKIPVENHLGPRHFQFGIVWITVHTSSVVNGAFKLEWSSSVINGKVI